MKQALKCVTALAMLTSFAVAGEEAPKDLKKVVEDQGIYVETAKPGIVLSGYVDAGYTYGFQGTDRTYTSKFPNDAKPGSNFGLNAFKLAIEKPLSSKDEFTAGFRTDLIYGDDASAANLGGSTPGAANTNTSDSLLVEQAFVQFRAPVGNGVDFKVGKFVTPLGYEVIERPANANISYGNLFQNMIPLYHTGVLASYKVNDIVDVKGGVVNGWNSDFGTNNTNTLATSGNHGDGAAFLATVNVTAPGGNANIQNGLYYGIHNASTGVSPLATGGLSENHPLWVYDVWGSWKPKFAGDKLTLGFNGDLGSYATSGVGVATNSTTWSGAALYAKYQFTKIFSLAGRGDWIHSDDGQKFGSATTTLGSSTSEDIYSYTLTGDFDVWENMLFRAEYRFDYGQFATTSGGTPVGFAGTPSSSGGQTVSLEVVYSF